MSKTNTMNEFCVPSGDGYDRNVNVAIQRRTNFSVTDQQMVTNRSYIIGGMTYRVNSIFDTAERKTVIDDVKHLIDGELNKVL